MISQENKQILDYIIGGATHDQIRKWIGLSEKNYWKRIAVIRKRDLELTKAEQTPEAHAFLYKRTDEKLHKLEVMAMQIAESKTAQVRDKLEAMRFLVQVYEDEVSLFLYGPSHFLVREPASADIARSADSSNAADDVGAGGSQKKPWPWPRGGISPEEEEEDTTTADES
jgi:hypothetical protein